MARGIIDYEGLQSPAVKALQRVTPPADLPFALAKLGHVVLKVRDVKRSIEFYTQLLGFRVSEVYPETMMKGGMVFLRCNADHHCLALIGGAGRAGAAIELHHLAFEVNTLDEVVRAREHLRKHGIPIDFEGRRRAGCQVAVEFRDPDNHSLEIFWGLDRVAEGGTVRPPEEWREEHSLEEAIRNPPPGQDTTLGK